MNNNNINWERLKNIGPTLKPFDPTKEKLEFLANWLLKKPLNLSDEERTPEKVGVHISYYFPYTIPEKIRPFHLFYEIGDFAGLLGFTDIHIGYKAAFFFKFWNQKNWNHHIWRDIKKAPDIVMNELDLQRMAAQTPDVKMLRLAKKLGFRLEARQGMGFIWNGEPYVNFLLRILKRDKFKEETRAFKTSIESSMEA